MLFQSQAPVRSCQQPLSSCSRPGQSETWRRSVGKPWSCLLNFLFIWWEMKIKPHVFSNFLNVFFFLVWNVRLFSYTLSKFTISYCIQNECSVRKVTDYKGLCFGEVYLYSLISFWFSLSQHATPHHRECDSLDPGLYGWGHGPSSTERHYGYEAGQGHDV